MTAPTVPVVLPADDLDDDDYIHVVCCDNNRALCGQDVADADWAPPAPHPDFLCGRCRLLAARPTCGAPWCRLRLWWRSRYGTLRKAGAS